MVWSRKKRDSRTVPDLPRLDQGLTLATFILLALNLEMFYSNGIVALLNFLGSHAVVCVAIILCKFGFPVIGRIFATKSALKQPRNIRKFADQSWQFVVHVAMTCLEVYLLNKNGWKWWTNSESLWDEQTQPGMPDAGVSFFEVQVLYIMQLGIWFVTAYSHKFVEAKHKDYFVMYGHHVVTILLVTLSYVNGWLPVGVVTLFLHDSSDVIVDLLKMFNYLGLDSNSGTYLVEICFPSVMVVWFVSRLVFYPLRVWIPTLPVRFGIGGKYPLPLNLFGSGNACRMLLIILQGMHIWWMYLLLKVFYKIVKGNAAHDAGREDYEGSSDSEGSDGEEHEGKKK